MALSSDTCSKCGDSGACPISRLGLSNIQPALYDCVPGGSTSPPVIQGTLAIQLCQVKPGAGLICIVTIIPIFFIGLITAVIIKWRRHRRGLDSGQPNTGLGQEMAWGAPGQTTTHPVSPTRSAALHAQANMPAEFNLSATETRFYSYWFEQQQKSSISMEEAWKVVQYSHLSQDIITSIWWSVVERDAAKNELTMAEFVMVCRLIACACLPLRRCMIIPARPCRMVLTLAHMCGFLPSSQ